MARSVFITATDTDAGKTVFSALFYKWLISQGINAVCAKFISSGDEDGFSMDLMRIYNAAGRESFLKDEGFKMLINPYSFKVPASAHLAARLEGREIDPLVIIDAYDRLMEKYEFLVVEGMGGVCVPLNENGLQLIDMVACLKCPVIIVFPNRLGAINHTLLTVEMCRAKGVDVLCLVSNEHPKAEGNIAEDNMIVISKITGRKVLSMPSVPNRLNPEQMSLFAQVYDFVKEANPYLW